MKKIITLLVAMVIAVICFSNCNAQSTAKSVDLDLPSGTLWADRNVGAASPEDYGDYFAWGETSTKSNFDWSNYKYANGDYKKITKYCSKSEFGNNGYTDTLTILECADDAAAANWGSDWCMPTQQQFEELEDNCTWTWTTRNGKDGYEVMGKNGNSIFLPATGFYCGEVHNYVRYYGNYWSSSLNTDDPFEGRNLDFDSGFVNPGNLYDRTNGQTVRPVRCK